MATSRAAHYAALLIAAVVLLVIGRDQWFFGDDWAILAPRLDDALLQPHVGHLTLTPALVFQFVRDTFGLDSYLPFLALAVLAHLAVCHLVWRILLRVGVGAWIATSLSILLMLLGGAAENLLWAFQFGFMGAIALGLAVVLLLDRPRLTVAVSLAILALSMLAPTFSGTAIPVLFAAGVVGWVRHGWWRTAALLAPAAIGWLVWYLLVARSYDVPAAGIHILADAGLAIVYGGAMFAGGLGRALPWIGLGVVPAVAVLVWLFATVRRGMRSPATPAYALVFGCFAFIALTAYARMSFGLSAAAAQRYAYLVVVFLLPAIGILLTLLAARSKTARIVTLSTVVTLAAFNAVVLAFEAETQSQRELASKERVLDSLDAVLADPDNQALLNSPADATWAPDLLGSDLLVLHENGQLSRR